MVLTLSFLCMQAECATYIGRWIEGTHWWAEYYSLVSHFTSAGVETWACVDLANCLEGQREKLLTTLSMQCFAFGGEK